MSETKREVFEALLKEAQLVELPYDSRIEERAEWIVRFDAAEDGEYRRGYEDGAHAAACALETAANS